MNQQDVIKHWAERWRSLAAWRAVIPMRLTFKRYKGHGRVGTAWSHQGRAQVNLTGDLGHDLATVLHELAHLAAPDSEHHGARWRELLVAAAVEAFGGSVDEYDTTGNYAELDEQVEDAAADWLTRTGQAGVLRGIGVMS